MPEDNATLRIRPLAALALSILLVTHDIGVDLEPEETLNDECD
jgi:hypothetical protein